LESPLLFCLMAGKHWLKRFVPGSVRMGIAAFRAAHKLSPSWEAAAAQESPGGYEALDLVELIQTRTAYLRDHAADYTRTTTDLCLALAIGKIAGDLVSVVDLGGACGAHYFIAKHLFPQVRFDWRVVETPAMVRAAERFTTGELSFYTNLAAAWSKLTPPLIAHTAGTLQCVPCPLDLFRALAGLGAPCLLLNRAGVHDGARPIYSLHRHQLRENGQGVLPERFRDRPVAYPFAFVPRADLETEIRSAGYRIKMTAHDPSGIFPIENVQLTGLSYYCER